MTIRLQIRIGVDLELISAVGDDGGEQFRFPLGFLILVEMTPTRAWI